MSTRINAELNPHYRDDYWLNLNDNERKNIKDINKGVLPFLISGMNKTKGLVDNTILYHGVDNSGLVNIHSRIGDKVDLKSFISTSFHESVAETYGGNTSDNGARLYIKFLAPKGVKGVASNCRGNNERYLSPFPWEHEYLLDKGQSGRIVDIDYDTGCVTVLLE